MKPLFALAAVLFAATVGVSDSFADPIVYSSPWVVEFGGGADGNFKRAAFGAASTMDAQVTGLLANVAVAKAEAVVATTGVPSAMVRFTRPFDLAPDFIYQLSLTASLTGSLGVASADDDRAQVSALALIRPQAAGARLLLVDHRDHADFSASLPPGTAKDINTGNVTEMTAGFTVGPGKYEVVGLLQVLAASAENDPGVDGLARFFDSFEVFADVEAQAAPVPEPSVLALLAALIGVGRRRFYKLHNKLNDVGEV